MAPHHWFVHPILGLYISFGVGCCFIHAKGNAKTWSKDKAISSHTFIYIRFHPGIVGADYNKLNKMKTLKMFGMAAIAVLMGIGFVSCSKDGEIAKIFLIKKNWLK